MSLKKRRSTAKAGRRKPVSLAIEQLDKREMLDASGVFGSIDGIVAIDLNNSGVVDSGETLANAEVKIVLDDGNGVYNAADTVVRTVTTNANGYYRASGLASGNYFTVQCAQTVDGYMIEELVSPAKTIDGTGQIGTSVDSFDDNYGPVVDTPPSGTPEELNYASTTALGGEIDLAAHAVSGMGSDDVTLETDAGWLEFSSDFDVTGSWTLTYDGTDTAGGGVDGTGLGGVDLTDIGGTSGAAQSFLLSNLQVDPTGLNNTTITVRVYSSNTDYSETSFSVTSTDPTDYCVDFSSFTTESGAGADFTNVGAIQMVIGAAVNGVDGQLDFAGSIGSVPEYCAFLNPQPVGSIDVEKFTNGAQADDAADSDVPTVFSGSTVTWTYVVTNDGEVPISNVTVTDSPQGAVTTITDQGNGDAILDVGESWTYTLSGTAITGNYGNSGSVSGDAGGTVVMDSDTSNYVGVAQNPQVDIEKFINGAQADNATDSDVPRITEGASVTNTYVVTNPGNVALTNVVVTDSVGGTVTNLISGDTNSDGILDTTETWTYEVVGTATLGDHACTATVTNDEGVTDSDDSHYVGVAAAAPQVDIEKFINGAQADNATDSDVPRITEGASVTNTYVVTNPGNVALTNVVVTDSVGGTVTNLISGDTNSDGILDTTETWTYEVVGTATLGDHACTATVTNDEGVTDSDDSHYVGVAAAAPQVDIEKTINGQQADTAATAVQVAQGSTLTFSYTVDNLGNVPLTNVVVSDSASGTVSNLVSGDVNSDGILDVDETWVFEVMSSAALGAQSCTATVTTAEGVTDSDDSHYEGSFVAAPEVDIEKFSNGQQADNLGDADVPTVAVGSSVTLTYVVTNPGNVPLTNVTVTDSVHGVISNLVSGDTNNDGALDTTETWTFGHVATAALGDNACTGTVTSDQGVTDADDSHHRGALANINVVKRVLGTPVALAANADHFEVTYEATVKNTGPITLRGLDLFDDVATQFGAAYVSVSSSPAITGHTLSSSADLPTLNSGWAADVSQSLFNDDGAISAGETITLQFVVVVDSIAARGNPVNNQIQAVADDPVTGSEFGPLDFSDDGVDNDSDNPGFPGDTGGGDDPSPVVLPFSPSGTISGSVYVDANNNGEFDAGESPIAGVEIMLTDSDGGTQSVTTDAAGGYTFVELPEGDYQLMQIHPVAFLDGLEHVGDFGGQSPENDKFNVPLFFGNGSDPNGLETLEYDFGELGADPRVDGKNPFLISSIAAAGGVGPVSANSFTASATNVAVLDGDTLVVMGTGGIDEVVITAGPHVHQVDVNGIVNKFSAEQYRKIRFDGSTGDDRVTLIGSGADDHVVLKPFEGRLTSEAYEISVQNARFITASGGDGLDDAFLVDGAGDDVFLGSASFASMRDVDNAYKNELRGFEKLTGNAVMGGNDTAVIYDSWRDDAFLSVPGYSQMIGGEYEVRANKFEVIEARADAGGHDTIEIRDSIGDDVFVTDGHRSTVNFGTGYRTIATGFESSDVLSRTGSDSATATKVVAGETGSSSGQNRMRLRGFRVVDAESNDDEKLETSLANVDFVFERLGE